MACAITSGYTLDCRESVGGLKKVLITNFTNVNQSTPFTFTAGVITGITMVGGAKFWAFEQVKETSNYVEDIQVSDGNGTVGYLTTLTTVFNKSDTDLRNQIRLLAQSSLMIIILDRNGKYWMMGQYAGADMTPSKHTSGTAMADRNGYELTFVSKENLPMYEISAAAVAAVTGA
jgi:hypothetical protein